MVSKFIGVLLDGDFFWCLTRDSDRRNLFGVVSGPATIIQPLVGHHLAISKLRVHGCRQLRTIHPVV